MASGSGLALFLGTVPYSAQRWPIYNELTGLSALFVAHAWLWPQTSEAFWHGIAAGLIPVAGVGCPVGSVLAVAAPEPVSGADLFSAVYPACAAFDDCRVRRRAACRADRVVWAGWRDLEPDCFRRGVRGSRRGADTADGGRGDQGLGLGREGCRRVHSADDRRADWDGGEPGRCPPRETDVGPVSLTLPWGFGKIAVRHKVPLDRACSAGSTACLGRFAGTIKSRPCRHGA